MKNIYEVLRQKELEMERLRKDIEALRVVAPMLMDEKEQLAGGNTQPVAKSYAAQQGSEQPVGGDGAKTARVWP
ncbi:MAG TPA: hypothetical protein VGQ71_04590 [Terriglobales bacterium]|jgi:hypothetical protein|nr:hypothetical protein [Terriglobales bacterium]